MPSRERVAVVGGWHLACVTAACLARLGYEVTGIVSDPAQLGELKAGRAPLFEPGLDDLIGGEATAGRLAFTADYAAGVSSAACVIVAIDTPVDEEDRLDLSPVIEAVDAIAPHLAPGATLVIESQVPVGTCDDLRGRIAGARPGLSFGIACVPENLRLGAAVARFMKPDMLILGAPDAETHAALQRLFAPIDCPKLEVDLRTAEMTKHAINVYLATCISLAAELANLCDFVGADALKVQEGLKLDTRVSPKAPLRPGLGFAGGTLARDVRLLQGLGHRFDYEPLLVDAVLEVSRRQNRRVPQLLADVLGDLAGRRVAILGLTYKAGTSTLRRSSALEVIQDLHRAGVKVAACDPRVDLREAGEYSDFTYHASPYEAAAGAEALVLLTEWPEFASLDLDRLRRVMARPIILDPGNALDPAAIIAGGFRYRALGRRALEAGG